jgi:hypothetical protein
MRDKIARVSPALMERAGNHISCHTLDCGDPAKSRAKVFVWQGKTWTATSGMSKGHRWREVKIYEVVTSDRYSGPRASKSRPFYRGCRFRHKGADWTITGNVVVLVPDEDIPPPAKAEQLSLV